MFGSGGGFGNRTTSAFGQSSTFGRPTTTFAQPGFGAGNTSLFGGQTSQASTSLFGNTAPTQSFGGGFASGTGTSLFGSQQPAAGSGGSLFGSQNATMNSTGGGLFGSSNTTAFGSNVGGMGGFGSTTSTGLFGQTQQPATQSSTLFGQPSTTGLFGSSTSGFATGGAPTTGTTIKFNPVTGTDTMQKNNITSTINTKLYCITCMKEYEGKSLEELRYEDYLANRKGPTQGAQGGSALFGGTGQSTLFGNTTSTANTTGGGLFGSTGGGFGQTSVFGQGGGLQSGNSLFGKPASTAPFGATTTTQSTGFGSFGQNTNLFGSNTNQAKPAFGVSQPSTGLFGSTPQATTGFGTQSAGFGFNQQQQQQQQQQNPSIGLFGQSQNKFGSFGNQTTSTGFSFGQNAPATSTTSLFGQKPATSGFGMTATTSASAFGTATPFGSTTATAGSLFSGGFNKPQATGFSFGSNTTTAPTLGGTNLGGGSLFGNTAAKPTGLFGNTATSTGLFGSTNFGTGTGGAFGTSSNTGFGGLSFGSIGSGGLSGAQPTAASSNVTDQIQFLTVLPYGDSPLYKHLRPATGKTEDLLKPSVVPQKPNTDSSSFKVSTQINNIVSRKALSAVTLEPAKKSLFDKDYDDVNKVLSQQKASPRYLKLKPKSMLNKSKISADTNIEQNTPTVDNTNKENIGSNTYTISTPYSPPSDFNSFLDNTSLPTSPALSKSTQISVDVHSPPTGFVDNTMNELRSTQPKSSEGKKNVSFSDNQDSSYQSYNATSSFTSDKSPGDEEDVNAESGNYSEKEHACGIILRRGDYFTVPSLSDLDEMVDDDGKCIVKNFTIGRHNFGNVTFYDAFDVSGLNLDTIVFFRHKEVEIYPNDDVKPPVGVGLNRRAQVTLDRVWPQDKATRQVIKDPERLKQMNFVAKLKRSSEKMNAQFIEYRPPTGSWVFEVEHFSKYGLDDSDEETPQPVDDKTKKLVPPRPFPKATPDLKKIFNDKQDYNTLGKKRGLDGKIITSEGDPAMDQFMYDENDETMDDGPFSYSPYSKHHDSDREFYESELHSPIEKLARDLDTSLHKVQLMKASFYVDENTPLDPEISLEKGIPDLDVFATGRIDAYRSTLATKNFPSLLKTQFASQFPPPVEIPFTDFADEEYKPPLYSPEIKPVPVIPHVVLRPQRVQVKFRNGVVPLNQSVFQDASKCLCDVGIYFGQHFRIGWGKGLTLATQSSVCTANSVIDGELDYLCRIMSGRKETDYSPSVVHKLEMSTYSSTDNMKEITENHLDVCLRESVFNFEDGCPILTPKLGTDALHAHCDIEQRISRIDEDYNRQVWELIVALWGNIPDIEMEYDPKSHKNKMLRKKAISDWLKNVVSSMDEDEINESDPVASVMSLLSAGKIYEAAKIAMSNDDYNLALLISQIGSSEITRSLMEQQLKQWHESEADQLIDNRRLKIMALVAGHMLFVSSKHIVNTCENLDWKRAFALHLWYITRPSDSLIEALNQYELAFKSEGKFANPPDPPYTKFALEYEKGDGRKAEDLCYHLLKLYSRRSYPLETLLNPITHTANVLDYRLSWLIMITLKSLGYTHLSEESEFILSTSFAAQLEAQNLWQWAVFVLLHIKDLNCRINRVTDTIGRNVRLLDDRSIGLTAEEEFVSEKLEVPVEWIYYAKAILASTQNRYKEAAWYYVKAERWNEAHDIIMDHLVTNAVINENYTVVQSLLDEIVASERVISGWNHKGGIIYDYLTVMNEINAIMAEQSIEIALVMEKLQPTMSSVCHKIKFFPINSIKDRLCQAEISKRMIQFIRTILNLQYGKAGPSVRFFVSLVDQLPLPEDYKMQELNEIISWWINK